MKVRMLSLIVLMIAGSAVILAGFDGDLTTVLATGFVLVAVALLEVAAAVERHGREES